MSSPASSLPDTWVQRIWATMRATYGAAFDRMWATPPGSDPAQHAQSLMAHWAKELGRYTSNPQAITFAIENLPPNPPNLIEFKALCNRRPDQPAKVLPAPPVDKAAAQAALSKASQSIRSTGDMLEPVRNLMRRELAGDKRLTRAQREFWRIALRQEILAKYRLDILGGAGLSDLADAINGHRAA